jgi:prepilin-type N-terminal cleavage/methylation domain-containing protein
MTTKVSPRACRGVCVKHLTNLIGASRGERRYNGFTLIELILVFGIIAILAGLVLTTVGYARKKGARARAETEIAAMSAACENYKADNGVYPKDPTAGTATDTLDPKTTGNPAMYQTASLVLYRALSGDRDLDRAVTDADKSFNIDGTALSPPLNQLPKSYFTFKPNMLSPTGGTGTVTAIIDPFGNSYGYSTAFQHDLDLGVQPTHGYNPTFDLWSTVGLTSDPPGTPPDTVTPQWIKNW